VTYDIFADPPDAGPPSATDDARTTEVVMPPSRNARVRIARSLRAVEAMELRLQGLNYKQIGERMGFTEQRAWKLVSQEFDRLNEKRTERATDVLRLELDRLDEMFAAVYARACGGDLKAIAAALKIVDKRADLLGLKLIRHEVKLSDEHTVNVTAKIDEYAAELGRLLGTGPIAIPSGAAGDGGREPVDQADTDADAEPVPGV
jgi:hypothetical protein